MTGYTNTFALGSTNSWMPTISGQSRWWQARPAVSGWHGRSLTGGFVQPNQPLAPVAFPQTAPTVGGSRQRYGNEISQPGAFTAGGQRRGYRSRGLNA